MKVFYKLIESPWVYLACDFQSTQNKNFAMSLQYLKDEIDFKLILSFYVCHMPKLPKITGLQFFLKHVKKKVSDEVDFLHAYKHGSFLHIDTIISDGDGQAFLKFPK